MAFGYLLFTQCSLDNNKNKHDCYRGKASKKKFCANIKEHATEIINCDKKKKKKMLPLTKKQEKEYKTQKLCRVCKRDKVFNKDQNYCKVRDQCEREEAPNNICHIRYQTSKEIYLVFQNGANYDYHSIIRERGMKNFQVSLTV